MTNVVAGTQIRQIARDQQPLDGSRDDHIEAFMKDMGLWSDAMGKDSGMEKYGYVDLPDLEPVPYGTAAGAS